MNEPLTFAALIALLPDPSPDIGLGNLEVRDRYGEAMGKKVIVIHPWFASIVNMTT